MVHIHGAHTYMSWEVSIQLLSPCIIMWIFAGTLGKPISSWSRISDLFSLVCEDLYRKAVPHFITYLVYFLVCTLFKMGLSVY